MKKTIIMLAISFCIFSSSKAQASASASTTDLKFITMMETNLKMLDTAQSSGSFIMLANNFERIGNAEKKYWQPWYYASLCYAFMAMNVADKTMIDPLTTKAEEYLEKANVLSIVNSEISALHGMIINTKVLADPINRWQAYSLQSAAMLAKAKEQEPLNPRPYLIEARTKLFTPAAMGGGAETAKPIIEKALANFKEFKPENSIAPAWGLAQTQKLHLKVNGN